MWLLDTVQIAFDFSPNTEDQSVLHFHGKLQDGATFRSSLLFKSFLSIKVKQFVTGQETAGKNHPGLPIGCFSLFVSPVNPIAISQITEQHRTGEIAGSLLQHVQGPGRFRGMLMAPEDVFFVQVGICLQGIVVVLFQCFRLQPLPKIQIPDGPPTDDGYRCKAHSHPDITLSGYGIRHTVGQGTNQQEKQHVQTCYIGGISKQAVHTPQQKQGTPQSVCRGLSPAQQTGQDRNRPTDSSSPMRPCSMRTLNGSL